MDSFPPSPPLPRIAPKILRADAATLHGIKRLLDLKMLELAPAIPDAATLARVRSALHELKSEIGQLFPD